MTDPHTVNFHFNTHYMLNREIFAVKIRVCVCVCVCVFAYSKEQPYGIVKEANQNDKEQNGKYGTDDSTHLDLFLVWDEGRGYNVGHQQEIDD